MKIKVTPGKGNFKDELKVRWATLSFIRICKSHTHTHSTCGDWQQMNGGHLFFLISMCTSMWVLPVCRWKTWNGFNSWTWWGCCWKLIRQGSLLKTTQKLVSNIILVQWLLVPQRFYLPNSLLQYFIKHLPTGWFCLVFTSGNQDYLTIVWQGDWRTEKQKVNLNEDNTWVRPYFM